MPITYGNELRRLREKTVRGKGASGQFVSLREIARHIGVSPTYVSDVERGFRAPFDDEVTVKICDYLDLEPTYLLTLAAQDRIRHALLERFPKLSEDAIGRMVKLAMKDLAATA